VLARTLANAFDCHYELPGTDIALMPMTMVSAAARQLGS